MGEGHDAGTDGATGDMASRGSWSDPTAERGDVGVADRAPVVEPTLSDLLTRHKQRARIGDARIASLASDRAGIANYVTRSSVRNWSSGSAARVNNWRQLAAVAAALQLDRTEADELMRAGGCDTISRLLGSVRPDDEIFLAYWSDAATMPMTVEPEPAAPAAPVPETNPVPAAESARDADVAAVTSAAPAEVAVANEPIGKDGRLLMAALVGALLIVAIVLFALVRGGDDVEPAQEIDTVTDATAVADPLAVPEIVADPGVPPTTSVDLPADGALVNGDLISAAGHASHPAGLAEVQIIVKNQGDKTYWNPVTGTWDADFARFTVPVEQGRTEVTWSYSMPVPVATGDYRVRAWALSVSGVVDPIGPITNFAVENTAVLDLAPGTGADPNGPHQIVVEAETADPTSQVTEPGDGSTVGNDFVVSGTAEYEQGVAVLEMVFRRLEPEEYWHPDRGVWSPEFQRFIIAVDSPGAERTTWSWQPPEGLEPGAYRARVWARGSDDNRDEARNVSDFTVVADG